MPVSSIEAWEGDRAAFHAERRTIIGGSDAAAILGLSRWRTPMDVWVDKVLDDQPPREMTMRQFIGQRLEPLLGEMAGARFGTTFRRRHGLIRSKVHPFIGGHVDFVALEVKTSYSAEGWGDDGTVVVPDDRDSWDAIPIDYLLQVQHYLYVTEWPKMHVAVLIGHDDFRTYTVERVPGLMDGMVAAEVEFWHDFVETGDPPPMDGSEGAKAYLRSRFPRASGVLRTATPEDTLLISQVRDAKAAKAEAEREDERLSNILKARIGDDVGLAAPGVTVTWPTIERKPEVNWEAIAKAYRKAIEAALDAASEAWKAYGEQYGVGMTALDELDLDAIESLHSGQPTTYRRLNIAASRRSE